jgi:peptide/nickel transport system ATP-binding protein
VSRLLEVNNLSVAFPTEDGLVQATDNLSFHVELGETLAIVGESGSGKSVSSMAIMGLHNPKTTRISGQVLISNNGKTTDIVTASPEEIRNLRGGTVSMIFQDPMSALHPYFTIGNQISEAWLLHNDGTKEDARKKAIEMLELVGIPDAASRVDAYPHQFSGGMRQRVMIAMALVNHPKILIADEPTTALDVTIQAQILKLLREMQREFNMAVILITHDLGVVAEVADRVNVMYAGQLVEEGSVGEIFRNPVHPYTIGLLSSITRVDQPHGTKLKTIPGQPPSLISLPSGCSFEPRCDFAKYVPGNICRTTRPSATVKEAGHQASCHLSAEEIRAHS